MAAAAVDLFAGPVQLFRPSADRSSLEPVAEALEALRGLGDRAVVVVPVVGTQRGGKSTLLNLLWGRSPGGRTDSEPPVGFGLGHTMDSCTEGLWVWAKDHPRDPSVAMLLVDTEGLDAPESKPSYNWTLAALALLLSTTFIYQTRGSIDSSATDRLGVILQVAEQLMRAAPTGEGAGAGTAPPATKPSFLWLVRDHHLALTAGTAKEEMESKIDDAARQALGRCFRTHDCAMLPRPVLDDADLRNVEQKPYEELVPAFKEEYSFLERQLVTTLAARPLVVPGGSGGEVMSGSTLAALCEHYAAALSAGALSDLSQLPTQRQMVLRIAGDKSVKAGLAAYREAVAAAEAAVEPAGSALSAAGLAAAHREAATAALEVFCKGMGASSAVVRDGLAQMLVEGGTAPAGSVDPDTTEYAAKLQKKLAVYDWVAGEAGGVCALTRQLVSGVYSEFWARNFATSRAASTRALAASWEAAVAPRVAATVALADAAAAKATRAAAAAAAAAGGAAEEEEAAAAAGAPFASTESLGEAAREALAAAEGAEGGAAASGPAWGDAVAAFERETVGPARSAVASALLRVETLSTLSALAASVERERLAVAEAASAALSASEERAAAARAEAQSAQAAQLEERASKLDAAVEASTATAAEALAAAEERAATARAESQTALSSQLDERASKLEAAVDASTAGAAAALAEAEERAAAARTEAQSALEARLEERASQLEASVEASASSAATAADAREEAMSARVGALEERLGEAEKAAEGQAREMAAASELFTVTKETQAEAATRAAADIEQLNRGLVELQTATAAALKETTSRLQTVQGRLEELEAGSAAAAEGATATSAAVAELKARVESGDDSATALAEVRTALEARLAEAEAAAAQERERAMAAVTARVSEQEGKVTAIERAFGGLDAQFESMSAELRSSVLADAAAAATKLLDDREEAQRRDREAGEDSIQHVKTTCDALWTSVAQLSARTSDVESKLDASGAGGPPPAAALQQASRRRG